MANVFQWGAHDVMARPEGQVKHSLTLMKIHKRFILSIFRRHGANSWKEIKILSFEINILSNKLKQSD